ncbi:hypothetical protein CYMTET_12442 [Cymbomonas tetramitiformis]|uniref:Pseudouridine synthase n=1 Tax=Cymbomonas tetramitiformis TaxID=36881 RepID=A0AAE0GKE8_9CHLO|nr:hypothetical protein CYMTET_12442 [Cymbomonas tetramitiformis]
MDRERFEKSPFALAENGNAQPKMSDYIVSGGLRYVAPYHFDFVAHCKKRQRGPNILELFLSEFPQRSREYYEAAVSEGRLRVVGLPLDKQRHTPVKEGDQMRHFVHRHEPPVMDVPIDVLISTDEVVVVNKPPSMPVHHAGQYRKNTVIGMLAAMYGITDVKPIHRLDKPVSGLLLMAKNARTADRFRSQIESHEVKKVYVARVLGAFPTDEFEVDAPLLWDAKAHHTTVAPVTQGGKESRTRFKRLSLSEDGLTSVVECQPLTGRTHQIRVHLQHAGHPIANDVKYGGRLDLAEASFSPGMFLPAGAVEGKVERVSAQEEAPQSNSILEEKGSQGGAAQSPLASQPVVEIEWDSKDPSGRMKGAGMPQWCPHCPRVAPEGWDVADLMPIWLHAVRYSGDGWEYECPLPMWSQSDFCAPCKSLGDQSESGKPQQTLRKVAEKDADEVDCPVDAKRLRAS